MLCLILTHYRIWLFRVPLKNINRPVYIVCLILAFTDLSAQTKFPLNFETLTINDGLSQSFVSSIIQDKKGLMWFATSDGLNKYDGYTFTIYHHDPDDTTSIASDDLSFIFEDSKQRLWIATRHNGIDLFDRENNSFTHLRHTGENSLGSDNILSITEDKSGALWIRSIQGIDRLEIVTKTAPSVKVNNENLLSSYELTFAHLNLDITLEADKSNYITPNLFVDSRNHILLSTNNKIWEVNYNRSARNFKIMHRFNFPVLQSDHTATLIEDTVNHDIYANNGEVYRFTNYDFNTAKKIYRYVSYQAPWIIDDHLKLWLLDGKEIVRVSLPSGNVLNTGQTAPSLTEALSTGTVYYIDRTGVVWIATGGYGILKYDPEMERFHHILPRVNTYQLLESDTGKITTNGMLSVTIRKDQPVSVSKLIKMKSLKTKFPKLGIVSFTKDTTGNFWIGIHAGIIQFDAKKQQVKRYDLPATDQPSLPFPVFADRNDNIWMGYKSYFVLYNIPSGKFTTYKYPVQLISPEYDFLQCIFEDEGLLWLGSVSGLFRFDQKNMHMKHYSYHPNDSGSLSNNFIFSICNDLKQPGKYLWVGTKGGGLNQLDKTTGKFTRFSTKSGLANNVVYGILQDEKGNLWLSTNKGLSEFNPATKKFRNFDVSDGLQSNEFNRYAYCKTKEGLLVFGGLNGINYFNPTDIQPAAPPDVIITDFRLFNKTVNFKKKGSPLKKDISFANEVVLQYEQNVITFQFAAMDYRKADKARFRYMMKGFDKDWIYSEKVREATYTNLDPGSYRFMVQGSFANGIWGKAITTLKITVIAPWWRTWWFYSLLAVVTLSFSYILYRFRLYQLSKLERLRNRIARDLHDEVGSSISTIAIYSKVVHEHLGSSTFNNESLMKKITENANEIMESMNDIIWNINSKNDAFSQIFSRMREHAHQLFEAKGYTLHFNFDENLNRMKLKMEKRRDFYLIYKEALNNIAKYANGNNVWISLVINNTHINLTIKDDGKGFDNTVVLKSSNGLTNMKFRTAALNGTIKITSEPGKGTEIHLSF